MPINDWRCLAFDTYIVDFLEKIYIDIDDLPHGLIDRLGRIDDLLESSGGLRSRQITAMVIEQWERENKDKGFSDSDQRFVDDLYQDEDKS